MNTEKKLIIDYKSNKILSNLVKEAIERRIRTVDEAKFHTKALERLKKKSQREGQEWWRQVEAEIEDQKLCDDDVDPSKLSLMIDEDAGLIREADKKSSGLDGLMNLLMGG